MRWTTTKIAVGMITLGIAAGASSVMATDVLFQGNWTKKTHAISGGWSIVEDGGMRAVVLDDSFKTKNAPDLKIFLSRRSARELDNKNAVSDSVRVASLKSHKGTQRYEIPDDVDLDSSKSIVIHCEQYSKLWGVAELIR